MNVRKRALAFVMCILIIMTLLPFSAFAADTGDVVYGRYDENGNWVKGGYADGVWKEGNIVTKKEATSLGNDEYRIDLSVAITTKKTEVPAGSAATVLVLDCSGSMAYCAECGGKAALFGDKVYHYDDCKYKNDNIVKPEQTRLTAAQNAAKSFLDSYKGDKAGQGRYVAVVSFASYASTVCDWQDVSTEAGLAAVKSAISGISANGGTNTDAALRQAASLLGSDTVKNLQTKNAILLTDGVPTVYGDGEYDDGTDGSPMTSYYAQQAATTLKDTGADLYTVCFGATKDTDTAYKPDKDNRNVGKVKVTQFLADYIATSADKAYNADNTDALNAAFAAITQTIVDGITTGMVVNDSETEFVKMTSFPEAYKATANGYAWTLSDPVITTNGDETTYTYSVSYTVKLDTAKEGFVDDEYYPTNGVTTLHYKDADGVDKSIDFTVPGVRGKAPIHNVSYAYEGSLIPEGANDQLPKSADYRKGTAVPAAAVPSMPGYEFSGWTTDDVTVNADGSFTMPNNDVKFVGTWTKSDKLEYTVNYYLNGTKTPVAESKTVGGQTLDAVVTEAPISIDGYTALADQNGTITIAATGNVIDFYYYKNVTVTAKSNTVTYDGEEHSVSGFDCSDADASFDLTVGTKGTEVGEYDAKFADGTVGTVDASGKYIITEANDGKLIITPIDAVVVTITGNKNTVSYNGSEQSVTGYEFESSNPLYTANCFNDNGDAIAHGTDAGSYAMGLKAEQFKNTSTNFTNVEFVVTDGSLTIDKIDATFTGDSNTVTYTGSEQSITGITAAGLLKGHTYEGLTYAAKGTNAGEYDGAFTGTAVIKDAAGNDVTNNYNVKTEIGKLTINKAAIAVTFTGQSDTVTYTGSEQSITGITAAGLLKGHTYEGLTYAAKGTNAGEYDGAFTGTVVIKDANGTDVTENYAVTKTPGKLTINPITAKVTVTITGNTGTKPYNGTTQTVTGYTFNSDNPLYTESKVNFTKSDGATAAGITAGTYNMNLKPEHFSNKDTKNFTNVDFVVTDGWLRITPLDALVITANGATKPYDGKPLTESGFTYVGKLNKGDTIEAVVEGTITDAGEAANVVKSYKIMHGDVDVTASYGEAALENGTLTVTPRSVIMTSANAEKPYDGEPLTNGTVTVTGDGFIEGEGATYAVTGTQTDAGESDNTFTYTLKYNTKAGNYKIELAPGKLKVTPIADKVTVTITGNTDTKPYNGEKQSVKDYKVEISNKLYTENCFSFDGKAVAEGTDAGSYAMGLKAEQFKNTSTNFTNVEFVVTDGSLTIDKIDATFAGDSKTVTYTGSEQSITGITPTGLLKGHTYAGLTYAAKGTDAGEYNGAFTGTVVLKDADGNDVTKNYNVKTKIGKLTTNPITAKVTVTINGNTLTVKYDGDEHTVSGYTYEASNELYTDKDFMYKKDVQPEAKGVNADTYMVGLAAEDFMNINDNFTNVEFIVNDGSLVIEKRVVKLTSASDEKTYDGKPLTNDTVNISGDGFVKDDAVLCDVTGSQTATGSSENKFTYKAKGNTNLANYEISTEFGTLTVKQLLETSEHFNYVIGYPDGTIRPNCHISRAEVATIFFRLLTDDARAEFNSTENSFKDVAAGSWYNRAISTLANANILVGDENGNFRPNDPITRAEMATIIARFDKLTETGKTFSDIKGHWAQKDIEMATTKGWLNGYPDGTFRPNNAITRAETFKMINRVLNRCVVSQEDLLVNDMNVWTDNMDPEAWFYYDVQEATNNHECERIDMSEHEHWTKKLTDIDWASYEL